MCKTWCLINVQAETYEREVDTGLRRLAILQAEQASSTLPCKAMIHTQSITPRRMMHQMQVVCGASCVVGLHNIEQAQPGPWNC